MFEEGSGRGAARAHEGLLAVCLGLAGCGTILFPTDQEIEVHSNVPTAYFHVKKRGAAVRDGATLKLDRTMDWVIDVTADGYQPRQVSVVSTLSVWRASLSVVLNLGHGLFTLFISTFIGIGADMKAGAWQCLEATPVEVDLVPGGPPASASPAPANAAAEAPPEPAGPVTCPACGESAPAGKKFCTSCGGRVR